jgi:tetratricopeptide (TPR) repeat protein
VVVCALAWAGCANPKPPSETVVSSARPSRSDARCGESEADLKNRAAAHAHYAQGVILELQHRRAQSLAEYRQAALFRLDDESLVWEVCRKFLALQDPRGAADLLARAAERPAASGLTLGRWAAVELQMGNTDAALRAGQRAIARDPSAMPGHQSVFLAYLQKGEMEPARAALDTAQSHVGQNPEFLIQLSELYSLLAARQPSNRQAFEAVQLELLERAAALPIDGYALKLQLADGMAGLGRNDQAAELYQQVIETMPEVPGLREAVRAKLTEAYLRGKDPARARAQLEQFLEDDPTNVRLCYLLGVLAYERRDWVAARDYFERILVLRPEFQEAYYDLAEILLNLDRVDEAEEVVAKARNKFPTSFALELLSALVQMRRGEYAAALGHFASAEINAQAVDPRRLTHFFYFQYGAASEQAGDHAGAERYLRKSLELNPGFAPAQNYLGYLWAERGENLVEALELISSAVRSEPTNAAYLDSLGWVLFRLNRVEDALTQILKAIQHIEEPDATVYEHLGDIQERLGRRDDAVAAWRKAFEIKPSEALRRKLEEAGHPTSVPRLGGQTPE